MKKLIITIIITILLTSCGIKKETTETWTNDGQKVDIKTTSGKAPVFEEKKVETEVNNWELTIANQVKIKEGKSNDFPSDFPIISWGEIYQNSNMQKYAFIIEKDKTIQEIFNYYKEELVKKWYTDKTVLPKDLKLEDLNIINMTLENQKEKVTIFINKEVPEVLRDNLKLEWNFIEVQYMDKIN